MIATINKVWCDISEHTHIHMYSPSVTHTPSKVGWYLRAILQPPFSLYTVNARRHHCSLVLFRLVNEHLVTGGGQAKALCVGSGKAGLDWWEHGGRWGFRRRFPEADTLKPGHPGCQQVCKSQGKRLQMKDETQAGFWFAPLIWWVFHLPSQVNKSGRISSELTDPALC